jgi:hypothetical protein
LKAAEKIMYKKLTPVFLILFLGNIFGLAAFAQKSSPTGLTLEINFYKGRPPAYQTVAESATEAGWAWYSLFKRIPDFQISADSLPVRAVKIVPYLEKDAVKINVSVFTGRKIHEKEETVGVYSVRENERVTIKDLARFGVEPFEIAVVRVASAASVLPSVVNKTNSLQITGIEPIFSTLPSYKIRMLNTSAKAVSAFTFETTVNGQRRLSGLPQGGKGKPLIESGATFEKEISNSLEHKQPLNGQIPPVQENQILVISSVIFDDGTYEGDAKNAAGFRAFTLGRKVQLKKIIALLQKATETDAQISVLDNLDKQFAALGREVDDVSFNELVKEFPTLTEKEKTNLRISAEVASNGIQAETRKELQIFRNNNSTANADSIRAWLATATEQYQNWLVRLP